MDWLSIVVNIIGILWLSIAMFGHRPIVNSENYLINTSEKAGTHVFYFECI